MKKYILLCLVLLICNDVALAQYNFLASEQTFKLSGTLLDVYQVASFSQGGGGPCDLSVSSNLTINNDTVELEILYNLVIPSQSSSCFDLDTFQTNVNSTFYKLITHASVIHTTNLMLDTSLVDSDTLYNFPASVGNVKNVDAVNIYPNPASQVFYIRGNKNRDGKISVAILSVTGELLEQYEGHMDYIDISNLSPALYIIRIKQRDNYIYRKLILTR